MDTSIQGLLPINSGSMRRIQNYILDGKLPRSGNYTWDSWSLEKDELLGSISFSYRDIMSASSIRDLRISGKELNDNLIFGSKEALEAGLKEQFVCCESHAAQLFPDIIQDLFHLNYLTLEELTKASMAPDPWVYNVSQAIIPTVLSGQDVLEATAKEISRRLVGTEFRLGAKESRGLQTINQKIASLPAPIARTVRTNAKRLQDAMSATTNRRLGALKGIPDEVWDAAVAKDELAEQLEAQ